MNTLEAKKAAARAAYLEARQAMMQDRTEQNWKAFCDAKRVCRLLGVRV